MSRNILKTLILSSPLDCIHSHSTSTRHHDIFLLFPTPPVSLIYLVPTCSLLFFLSFFFVHSHTATTIITPLVYFYEPFYIHLSFCEVPGIASRTHSEFFICLISVFLSFSLCIHWQCRIKKVISTKRSWNINWKKKSPQKTCLTQLKSQNFFFWYLSPNPNSLFKL